MASEEPVRMLESEPRDFELTELDGPEEELLGRYLPIGDVAKSKSFWGAIFRSATWRSPSA